MYLAVLYRCYRGWRPSNWTLAWTDGVALRLKNLIDCRGG